MTIWADEMILQYKKFRDEFVKKRNTLNKKNPQDKLDLTQYNSMIEEMEFVLQWLESGRDPNNYRGADKRGIYQNRSFQSMDFIPDITEQLEDGPKHLYMSPEEKIIMGDIFSSLSFRERHCYILHVGRQISVGKIAEGLGVGKSTVQSYIERAKKKVAQESFLMVLPYVCRTKLLYMKWRKKEGIRARDQSLPQPHLFRKIYSRLKGFYSFIVECSKKGGISLSSDFERKVFLENQYLNALKEIEQEITKSSDRGTVLICGSVLDELLKEVLSGFLIEGKKKEEDLFKSNGTLSSFNSKIVLTFYLGLINKNEYDNLRHLQKIRNIFAHQVIDISFENNKIKNHCSNFDIPKNGYGPRTIPFPDKETNELPKIDMNPIKSDTPAKDRFLFSFYYLFGCLVRKSAISFFGKREELTEILTADEVTKDSSKRLEELLKAFTDRIEQGRKKYDSLRKEIVDKVKVDEVNSEAQSKALINLEELKKYIDNEEVGLQYMKDMYNSMEETSKYVFEVLENSKEK